MYYVYAIKSQLRKYIYVGLTINPTKRYIQHNSGNVVTTRPYKPFVWLLLETHSTRKAARKREKYLKSGIGKEYLKSL